MTNLDNHLSPEVRHQIEQHYYARVNAQAHLDRLATDAEFLQTPEDHVAFYADHGVVHVRDVAQQILQVLAVINGILIPARKSSRRVFMQGYGVMLAYLHDIGMVDFSHFGRAVHPEFAAQAVFKPEFDYLLQIIWEENCGNIAWRLLNLANQQKLAQKPKVVLRELLAMALCHSKSKVAMTTLNNPQRLRATMQIGVGTALADLYQQQQAGDQQLVFDSGDRNPSLGEALWLQPYYKNFQQESFSWLVSEHGEVCELVDDVIDTLRALRCADALRQRGTALNTSGGYQIFVDGRTANAIHAFQKGADEMLLLLETADSIAAGEANLASSELTIEGNLRISFHRGAFGEANAVRHAVNAAATVVNDIQADVIGSFQGVFQLAPNVNSPLKSDQNMQILLEGVDDNPDFAPQVCQALQMLNPALQGCSRPVPSLQNMSVSERARYLKGADLAWSSDQKREALLKIAESGHKVTNMNSDLAFEGVRLISVEVGEVLIESGSPPGFVYIPLSMGLKGIPLSGYHPFFVYPWTPLGNTSVIRGAIRNATLVVEQPLQLLMIPKEVYLTAWHSTYTKAEFKTMMDKIYGHD